VAQFMTVVDIVDSNIKQSTIQLHVPAFLRTSSITDDQAAKTS